MSFTQLCNAICDNVEERILMTHRPISFREALFLLDVVGTPTHWEEKYMLGIKVEMATMPIVPFVTNTILRGRYDEKAGAIRRDEHALHGFFKKYEQRYTLMENDCVELEILTKEMEDALWHSSVMALSRIFGAEK